MKNSEQLEFDELYSILIDEEYFTEQELQLITCINGHRVDVLEDCIYCRYGYRSYQQMKESEAE